MALRRPAGVPAGRIAARRHPRGVRRRRDPAQRCPAPGRPGPRGAVVGESSQRAARRAGQQDRRGARAVFGRRAGGDAATLRRAGRRGGYEPGPRPGPGGHPRGRTTRRQRPLPARRVPRRPGGAPARHRGRPQRVVERRRRGDPDAGPAHHRDLGAPLRRQHATAQRAHLQPALHDHRDRQCRRHASCPGRRSPGDPLQAVRGPIRSRLPRRGQARRRRSSATPNRTGCISRSRWEPIGY